MGLLGSRVKRTEDPALLRGTGRYVGDFDPPEIAHAVFVRSVEAHAALIEVHTGAARSAAGVIAVFSAADLALEPRPPAYPPLNQEMTRTSLATDRVRYVGEPVAVVVAESAAAAVDAAELVWVETEPLDPVVGVDAARRDESLLFPAVGSNCCFAIPGATDPEFFSECEVRVALTFDNSRVNGAPIEPRAALARWEEFDGRLRLTQHSSTQFPHSARDALASHCGVDAADVRVITPEVGGGFGAKNGSYPEDIVVALAARRLRRPVRWVETRTESMLNLAHGRAQRISAELGGSRDGTMTHYRLHVDQDAGAYPGMGAFLIVVGHAMATGVYDIPHLEFSGASYVTNTAPVGAYRGAGRPEATHAIERMVDVFAAEIGLEPEVVRRQNFIPADAFPFSTPSGQTYESGRYEAALDRVVGALDLAALRSEQVERRRAPDAPLLGVGFAAYVEIANPLQASEFGSVEVRGDGSVVVLTGSSAHGQGHHTAYAQVAADVLGVPFDRIEVRHGDTDEVKRGGGTGGSRSLQVGGTAVHEASAAAVDRAKQVVASMLEANPADIVLDVAAGTFAVAGSPTSQLDWADVAAHAERSGEQLLAEIDFKPTGATFPFGVHASVVEVDRRTGAVSLQRHIACDDAGVVVNPMIVDGQVHGGIASGVAQAVMEEFRYDEFGTPLTSNFMDYGIMSAAELPFFDRLEQETPTQVNPLGVKGVGEAGTIGSMPAVQNAVVDALRHLGVRHLEIPLTPQRVWHTLANTKETA